MIFELKQWVLGIGTFSFINAGIAQSKKRSGLNWFLFTLLLGPIATLLLITIFCDPPG